ncbi:MAG: bifunctional nuclease family protein [Planctomycetota bacterium]|nr:bifunctional nuclease family protein [Planctomycetota bacterium]
MRLQSIKINDTGDRQYIGLAEVDGDRSLTIVIGYNEVQAIDRFVKDVRPPRPMTHELVSNLIEATGARVERVDVTELRGGTYFAMIRLLRSDGTIAEVDARPSDAIALATALKSPIFVAEDVLREASAAS